MAIMRSHSSASASATGPQEHQAGIVDQRVQPPESLDGLPYGRLGLGAVGDVRFYGQRGAARLADLGGEGFKTVPAAGHQRDGGAMLGEPAGGGRADAAARAGDQGGGPRAVPLPWVV